MNPIGEHRARWRRRLAFGAAVAGTTAAVWAGAADANHDAFVAENALAMNRMMAAMEVEPSGSVDRDFVAMMIPHHQGAIEMAQAVLRHGSNEQLRRIAQEIIVDQQQEIAAMHLALNQPLPPSAPAPTQSGISGAVPAHTQAAHHRETAE
jgi:hypothetical protein